MNKICMSNASDLGTYRPRPGAKLDVKIDMIDVFMPQSENAYMALHASGVWPVSRPYYVSQQFLPNISLYSFNRTVYRMIGSAHPAPGLTWLGLADSIAKVIYDESGSVITPRGLLITVGDGKTEFVISYNTVAAEKLMDYWE